MVRYIYLLSDYDEYGAEDVEATSDPSNLLKMIERRYSADYPYKAEAIEALTRLLEQTPSALHEGGTEHYDRGGRRIGANPHNLLSGWGGPQLHVVKLDD